MGPPGLGVPPHRRLRSLFCRSTAVLPANTHNSAASEVHTFTDILTSNRAPAATLCPRGSEDLQSSTALDDPQRRADRSGTWSGKQDRQLLSHIWPPAGVSGRSVGRQGRSVTPLQTSQDPAIKEKQHQKRRKRSYRVKVDCAGTRAAASLTETDARLSERLQSLDLTDDREKDSNQQLWSGCSGVTGLGRTDPAASHRTDRRPHFLPPIRQSDSLLHVALLLPENSPPPSPCTFPEAPVLSLPVPPLRPITSRRK
ncbi:unnamed protein product [Pleuronectes platessa]|uniref:Uncharacterized protein n=1 Tax=Pleuronectes platessa TaxID=8262 RepID=A0A9N7UMX7_PLEPL|nr:unnamed protein product [Pleuronectes platessa]